MRKLPAAIWFAANVLIMLVVIQFRHSLPQPIAVLLAFWPFAVVPLAYAFFGDNRSNRNQGWIITLCVFVAILVARFMA